MTREEAKGSLIAIKNKYLANYGEDSIINILIDEYDIQAIDMAIQALEQEPCEDAVSRKALISHIEKQSREWGEDYDAQQILGDIEDMPSVNPQKPKWIPVSERLPEFGAEVLCQCRAGIYEVLKYRSYGWYHDDLHCYMAEFVIAWMPLPKTYESQESEG